MATSSTSTSTAVAAVEAVFTEPERLALAGFLAGPSSSLTIHRSRSGVIMAFLPLLHELLLIHSEAGRLADRGGLGDWSRAGTSWRS
jgi:hypothetical protein